MALWSAAVAVLAVSLAESRVVSFACHLLQRLYIEATPLVIVDRGGAVLFVRHGIRLRTVRTFNAVDVISQLMVW